MANTLSILGEAWKELSKEQRSKFERIGKWDMSFLSGEPLYRQGLNLKEYHRPATEEMKKWLAIRAVYEVKHMGMFGPMVVAAWHAFILDSINYEKFCKETYGQIIHHVPGGRGLAEIDTSVWLGIYHNLFGKLPPVWKLDLGGLEIPGMETRMNVELACEADHQDSDDGAY